MELINREEALKIFNDIHPCDYNAIAYKSKIENLPIIEVRPKGKWIDSGQVRLIGGYSADCSVCGEWSEYLTNFCGNCGAEMESEK